MLSPLKLRAFQYRLETAFQSWRPAVVTHTSLSGTVTSDIPATAPPETRGARYELNGKIEQITATLRIIKGDGIPAVFQCGEVFTLESGEKRRISRIRTGEKADDVAWVLDLANE